MPHQISPTQAISQIIAWSARLPMWQQDALRRLLVNGGLSGSDLDEIEQLCCTEHRVPGVSACVAHGPQGLTGVGRSGRTLLLQELCGLHNVAGLPNGEALEFAPGAALTAIYGPNGSGKSSYFRVLKQMCSTRGVKEQVRGNAFSPGASPPSAVLKYAVDGTPSGYSWTVGSGSPSELSDVYVFDSTSTPIHVDGKNPAQFLPFGLDILPKLATCCDEIRSRLEARASQQSRVWAWQRVPQAQEPTVAGAFIRGLNAKSTIAALEEASKWDEDLEKQLNTIVATLVSDGVSVGRRLRGESARLSVFADDLANALSVLSDSSVEDLKGAHDRSRAADEAAEIARSRRFDDSVLTGTGGAGWKQLWRYAREFSTAHAYRALPYPFVGDDARCVLCQQELSDDAKARLCAFEDFVQNRAEQDALAARNHLDSLYRPFLELSRSTRPNPNVLGDLETHAPDLLSDLQGARRVAIRRWIAIERGLRGDPQTNFPDLAALASVRTRVQSVAEALIGNAEAAEAATDPEARARLERQKQGLEAQRWLNGIRDDVEDQIRRLSAIERLEAGIKSTKTNPITLLSSELTDQLVTAPLTQAFASELSALRVHSLKVQMVRVKGAKGKTLHQCQLQDAAGVGVIQIASEGEQKVAALAAFLAELSIQSGNSCAVFDDPVSSLDHDRRMFVAKRLAELSRSRQVVVFTHDVVFLTELMHAASDLNSAILVRNLFRNGGKPGYVGEGLPWDWQGIRQRLDHLEKEARRLRAVYATSDERIYADEMRRGYSQLRATIERSIEDIVFGDVLSRFRTHVKVGSLGAVAAVTESHCNEFIRIWKHACDVTEAHDPARAAQVPIPTPDEFSQDLADFKKAVEAIKSARKTKVQVGAIVNPLGTVAT